MKIITGSLSGVLRIHKPTANGYKVEDELLETNLGEPILQIVVGNFVQQNDRPALAVLFPRRLAVYTVNAVLAQSGNVSYLQLSMAHEHSLDRTAANMTHGAFGGATRFESIAVQSMDGQISFYENETLSFTRYLPNFLLPGPLAYDPVTDGIITCNSAFEVELFRYTVLAAASGEKSKAGATPAPPPPQITSGDSSISSENTVTSEKRVTADWSVTIGETVLDVQMAVKANVRGQISSEIVVLGEHTLFILSTTGEVKAQRKLDFIPNCLHVYSKLPSGYAARQIRNQPAEHRHDQMFLVGTSTGSLMVYEGAKLRWGARWDYVPVSLGVGNFSSVNGLVASIDFEGNLSLTYMGTDPPLTNAGLMAEGKELNYEDMDEEHRMLLASIRDATGSTRKEPNERLNMRVQIPDRLDSAGTSSYYEPGDVSLRVVTAKLFVSYQGAGAGGSAEDVVISIQTPAPFSVDEPTVRISSVHGADGASTPVVVPIRIRCTDGRMVPTGSTVSVLASFRTKFNEPRTSKCYFHVPLCLSMQASDPSKDATYKLTVDTTRQELPSLASLFEDVLAFSQHGHELASHQSSAGALGLRYHNGMEVTILVSRNAGRLRLQANDFGSMWLVLEELRRRLTNYFLGVEGANSNPPFKMVYQEPLPLEDLYGLIDNHFYARKDSLTLEKTLEERAHQFRSIQKRLLVRFKDRNPSSLSHLDTLLEGSLNQIMGVSDELVAQQQKERYSAEALCHGVRLTLELIRLQFDLDDSAYELLASHITPNVSSFKTESYDDDGELVAKDGGGLFSSDIGWEEITDASVTNLLRTALSKNAGRDSSSIPQPLAPLADTAKLKKHINTVCDRLAKGVALSSSQTREDGA